MLNVETLSEGSVTQQVNGRLLVDTQGQGLVEITDAVSRWVFGTGILHGLLTVFCRHTSASLLIQENADPDVRLDLMAAFDRLAPRDVAYIHSVEGPDDMPAHIRTVLSGVSLSIPVLEGQMALGTWQGLYLAEHRDQPHSRDLILHLIGA
ncbi:secondary thiamine-phosphate synthase enzyme YjbQ [Microvirga guangxiensis]|uniref:Secondary thiamine-phosphate synthase enzyme n=1 Tax=Microvirga guangxiensis TaxID=549386 RepID=A0A1G5KX74_9HYPH|nr:secondary thiamine-phosphate synthase enzyme YjbQ [Microvirga guangxiensis]SCZ05187.1 secondary thiamine-phosphate synthase enzyme [Microvirga guangxiensis]